MAWVKKTVVTAAGLSIFLLFSPVYFLQHFWQKHVLKQHLVSLSFPQKAYASVLATVEDALKSFMPQADKISEEVHILTDEQMAAVEKMADTHLDPTYDRKFRFFIGKKGREVIGMAAQDAVPGKWGAIHYMIFLSPEGRVEDVMVLEYQEKRGKPVARNRFLKQFKGKGKNDEIRVMRDIRSVTGASISSNGMANGIRKMLHVFELFYGDS